MRKANTQAAKTFGSIAFAKGLMCAPCMDQNMSDLMAGRQIGDPRSIPEMKAWTAGWIEASLVATEELAA